MHAVRGADTVETAWRQVAVAGTPAKSEDVFDMPAVQVASQSARRENLLRKE